MSTSARAYGDPATRRQILAAAWSLVEEGDAEIRLADVASRAGVSRRAVYLHFGDRSGVLAALVEFMDEAIDVRSLAQPVWLATSPRQLLAELVAFYARLNPRIDAVARVLEARPNDAAARSAWRDRLETRRRIHRELIEGMSAAGALAPGWTVDTAADLLHAMMLPSVWRELADEVGWSAEERVARMTTAVQRALLADGAGAPPRHPSGAHPSANTRAGAVSGR